MSLTEQAVVYFEKGFNCSQSIVCAYGMDFGVDRETALKVSSGFGGGVGRMGGLCGALAGAFMVLGLKFGATEAADKESKMRTYGLVEGLGKKFGERAGSMYCRDLLGFDLGSDEGREKAKEEGSFEVCPDIIRIAGELLEEILVLNE